MRPTARISAISSRRSWVEGQSDWGPESSIVCGQHGGCSSLLYSGIRKSVSTADSRTDRHPEIQRYIALARYPSHISLLRLADDWALQADMPMELVLGHLCEWIAASAFSKNALIRATGEKVEAFDIYMSFRKISAGSTGGGIYIDGWTIRDGGARWGAHLLSEVGIDTQEVLGFCERTNTLLPRSLVRGFKRFWNWSELSKNLAPPACPNPEKHAAELWAKNTAKEAIDNLRGKLLTLQAPSFPVGLRKDPAETLDLDFCQTAWNEVRSHAEAALARCNAPDLRKELESLDAEWLVFVEKAAKEKVLAHVAAVGSEIQEKSSDSEFRPRSRRSNRGRPTGSGSYGASDAVLIEEMHPILLDNLGRSVSSVAGLFADRAEGGGSSESKVKRLIRGYMKKYRKSPK
jgi:hypothetical protein